MRMNETRRKGRRKEGRKQKKGRSNVIMEEELDGRKEGGKGR